MAPTHAPKAKAPRLHEACRGSGMRERPRRRANGTTESSMPSLRAVCKGLQSVRRMSLCRLTGNGNAGRVEFPGEPGEPATSTDRKTPAGKPKGKRAEHARLAADQR